MTHFYQTECGRIHSLWPLRWSRKRTLALGMPVTCCIVRDQCGEGLKANGQHQLTSHGRDHTRSCRDAPAWWSLQVLSEPMKHWAWKYCQGTPKFLTPRNCEVVFIVLSTWCWGNLLYSNRQTPLEGTWENVWMKWGSKSCKYLRKEQGKVTVGKKPWSGREWEEDSQWGD
jgi:hypothetical protein